MSGPESSSSERIAYNTAGSTKRLPARHSITDVLRGRHSASAATAGSALEPRRCNPNSSDPGYQARGIQPPSIHISFLEGIPADPASISFGARWSPSYQDDQVRREWFEVEILQEEPGSFAGTAAAYWTRLRFISSVVGGRRMNRGCGRTSCPGISLSSNRWSTFAMISGASTKARFSPRHLRGPTPNGM